MGHLSSLISTDVDEVFTLVIRRSDVLGSALIGIDRKAFSVHKTLEIRVIWLWFIVRCRPKVPNHEIKHALGNLLIYRT